MCVCLDFQTSQQKGLSSLLSISCFDLCVSKLESPSFYSNHSVNFFNQFSIKKCLRSILIFLHASSHTHCLEITARSLPRDRQIDYWLFEIQSDVPLKLHEVFSRRLHRFGPFLSGGNSTSDYDGTCLSQCRTRVNGNDSENLIWYF